MLSRLILLLFTLFALQANGKIILPRQPGNFAHLSTGSIDKLNAKASELYLSNPTLGRRLSCSALLSSKLINYKKGIGQSFANMSIAYWSQSYYPVSLLYADSALRYLDKAETLLLSDLYCHIGRIYADMRDYSSARLFLDKALITGGNSKQTNLDVMVERSYIYYKLNQFDKACLVIQSAMKISRQINDKGTTAILYSRLASISFAQKQYNKTSGYCDTAIQMSYMVNNKRLRLASFIEKSGILLSQKNTAASLDYAQRSLAMSDSLGIMDFKLKAYEAISDVYQALNNYKQVIIYQKALNNFQKSWNALEKQNNSQLMRDYFDLNSKLQDINTVTQNAKADNIRIKAQQQIIIVLVISIVLLSIALYIVWHYYQQKNNLTQKLKQQNIATLAQSQIIEAQAHKLEDLNNFKSRLLAIIGHDLRSPIYNLRSITDMFEEGSFSADEVSELMKGINPVVKGAELTLSNLLVWADGQIRGIKSVQAQMVNLLYIINEAEEICKSSLDKKLIKLSHSITPNCSVTVDENHLKVIFNNLISNAIKFTEQNGSIHISATYEAEKITIAVADTGIGITDDEITKLLSVNTHFTKPGTHGEKGTGIGLLLCRELIELNGGKLWVKSNLGNGTTFYFSLPPGNLQPC